MEITNNLTHLEISIGTDSDTYNADTVFGQKIYNLCQDKMDDLNTVYFTELNYQFGTGFILVAEQGEVAKLISHLLSEVQKFINKIDDIYRNAMALSDEEIRLDYLHQKLKVDLSELDFSASFNYSDLSEIKSGIDEARTWWKELGQLPCVSDKVLITNERTTAKPHLVKCIVCKKSTYLSKQQKYAAEKKGGYKHPGCAKFKDGSEKQKQTKNAYLKQYPYSWKSRGYSVDPIWMNDTNMFVEWVETQPIKYIRGTTRFTRKNSKQPWSPDNTMMTNA